jgi:hypothetical protein
MKTQAQWAALSICLVCAQSAAIAQKTPAQQTVAVVVVNADVQPAQPVPTVRVSLGYLQGSVLVTEARDVTNPKGQAWLDVSEEAAQHGGLRIGVDGAANLVIYQPADGELIALPATINVSMLPKGSPALLGPAQIEAMLLRGNCALISPHFPLLLKKPLYRTTPRLVPGVLKSCSFLLTCSATRGAEFPGDPLAFLDSEDAINCGQLDTFFGA